MSKESALTKAERARLVVTNLPKLFPKNASMFVGGRKWTRDELVAFYKSHLAALDRKVARYAAYREAVAQEKTLAREANDVWIHLYSVMENEIGADGPTRLGMKRHRKPGPKTLEAKVAGVQKRAKKRASG
jgi:hypothetical protein